MIELLEVTLRHALQMSAVAGLIAGHVVDSASGCSF